MLVPNQVITVSWHNVTRKHYEDKGYVFTKYRDYFEAKAEDLSAGCHHKVKVVCDYCGREFTKVYANLLKERYHEKDCCAKCQPLKNKEICMEKYGVTNGSQIEQSKIKAKQTFMEKYGVDNPMKHEEVKSKLQENCLDKYGVKYFTETKEFKEKAKQTFLENYGVENPFASETIKNKIKETCKKQYGTEYAAASKIVRSKIAETLSCENKTPTSKAERAMASLLCEMFGEHSCIPSYVFEDLTLDCLVDIDGNKIDIEYDGWYWHKNKQEKDRRRNYYLIRRGFKVVRFIAETAIPTKEDIQEAIDYIVKGNHSLYIKALDVNI